MKRTKLNWIVIVVTLLVSAVTLSLALPAARAEGVSQSYTWVGELVALDQNSHMMTIKAHVFGKQPVSEVDHLKSGDRIDVTWSNLDTFSDAIIGINRYDAKKSEERFTFPVEFVFFDPIQQYATFKAPIPADSLARINFLKPGEWVTVTSPHGKTTESTPIVAVQPYAAVPPAVDSN